jgi:FkbM family methyltransferase
MLNSIQEVSATVRRSFQRLLLFPFFLQKVRNWPRVLAARLGMGRIEAIEFRDGSRSCLLDLRAGLAVLRDVYLERVYDSKFHLDPEGTVLDLGANIGMFTILAAKSLVPRGRVVAVEANPYAAAVLRRNVIENGFSNVEVIEAAAAPMDGKVELHLAPHSLGATVFAGERGGESVMVAAIGVDTLIESLGPIELLKMDIEGSEWSIVFDSSPEMWVRIKRIAMEFHLDAAGSRTAADLVSYLTHVGYVNIRVHHPPGLYGYLWAELSPKQTMVLSHETCSTEASV